LHEKSNIHLCDRVRTLDILKFNIKECFRDPNSLEKEILEIPKFIQEEGLEIPKLRIKLSNPSRIKPNKSHQCVQNTKKYIRIDSYITKN